MEFNYKALGQRIKREREARDWTQAELAVRADMSTTHISSIERGNSNFSVGYLVMLTNAFGITPNTILYDDMVASVPEINNNMINETVKDCEPWEVRVLADCMVSVKKSIRKSRIAPTKQ